MSVTNLTWPVDSIDAISVWVPGGEVCIVGSAEDAARLEYDDEDGLPPSARVEQAGRWLLVHLWDSSGDEPLTVHLPSRKAWVVDLYSSGGEVEVSHIQARLLAAMRRGEMRVTDCQGVFTLLAPAAEVHMERCVERAMPERPALEDALLEPQARAWQEEFSRYSSDMGWQMSAKGMSVQLRKGDVHLEDVEAETCTITLGRGDVTLDSGCIGTLHLNTGRGDVECASLLPAGDWTVATGSGDITLSLPANAQARLDIATTNGDIDSGASLVRVARPGPEARHGRRMVGTVGNTDTATRQITLTSGRGDIEVDIQEDPSPYTAPPARPLASLPEAATDDAAPAPPAPQAYSSEMAVLQALSEKTISAAEAEHLLRSMGV